MPPRPLERGLGGEVFPCGRVNAEEMLDKEIEALVLAIGFAYSVMGTWNDHEFEGLVGFDECIGNLHGAGGINVVIKLSHDEHQRTLKTIGIFNIGTFDIGRIDRV